MAKSEGCLDIIDTMDVDYLKGVLKSYRSPRSLKEAALRRIREVEKETGVSVIGNYNSPRNPSEIQRQEEENGQ